MGKDCKFRCLIEDGVMKDTEMFGNDSRKSNILLF